MAEFCRAARVGEIAEGCGRAIRIGDREVAIFNLGGEHCAIDNTCPHRGGSLGDGEVHGDFVLCPMHAWKFNIRTGKQAMGPQVAVYPVKIDGEEILIEL